MSSPLRLEERLQTPVIHECDVCVIGGSCTGLFAALRAARLGLSVAIVEQQNCFGGVATASMVNIWHSLLDTEYNRTIIGGLTTEIVARLGKREVLRIIERNHGAAFIFNSEELKIDLDEIASEHRLKVYFHTQFVAPWTEDGVLKAAVVENKSGRGAIRARFFIDASGDADLASRLGLETYMANHWQPATTCARLTGWETLTGDFRKAILDNAEAFGIPEGFAWGAVVPGSEVFMLAATRVLHSNPAVADELTAAEIEGRRQVRALLDIFKKVSPGNRLSLQALPSRIGVRESRHVRCLHQLLGDEVLHGRTFPDAIANGSYRVDIHHQDKPGNTFRFLDGREVYERPGHPHRQGRWREETAVNPTFYQIPYRCLVPQGNHHNLLVAGRMIDADPMAHAAIRVMVNMNQVGEAAGVAAHLALRDGIEAREVDPETLRKTLAEGGSVMI
ncbi:MAG TPA: FAD-dependent oxidoreductase [Candidatus Methylacidiphilales bacterium]